MKPQRFNVLLALLLFVLIANRAEAQSTLVNTPSTDVQATGRTYVEVDFFAHFASYEKGGFQVYGTRVVYGAHRGMEIGANVFYTKVGDVAQPVEVQPNVKWQFYQNEKHGVQASVGGLMYMPATHRAGTDTFGMIYSSVSKKVNSAHGPRMTGGAYTLLGRDKSLGTKTGAMVGFEQPVNSRISFLADWYSGKNRFGYAGAGFAYTLSKKSVLFAGYNVGNSGSRNNYFAIFYAYTF